MKQSELNKLIENTVRKVLKEDLLLEMPGPGGTLKRLYLKWKEANKEDQRANNYYRGSVKDSEKAKKTQKALRAITIVISVVMILGMLALYFPALWR